MSDPNKFPPTTSTLNTPNEMTDTLANQQNEFTKTLDSKNLVNNYNLIKESRKTIDVTYDKKNLQ